MWCSPVSMRLTASAVNSVVPIGICIERQISCRMFISHTCCRCGWQESEVSCSCFYRYGICTEADSIIGSFDCILLCSFFRKPVVRIAQSRRCSRIGAGICFCSAGHCHVTVVFVDKITNCSRHIFRCAVICEIVISAPGEFRRSRTDLNAAAVFHIILFVFRLEYDNIVLLSRVRYCRRIFHSKRSRNLLTIELRASVVSERDDITPGRAVYRIIRRYGRPRDFDGFQSNAYAIRNTVDCGGVQSKLGIFFRCRSTLIVAVAPSDVMAHSGWFCRIHTPRHNLTGHFFTVLS